MGNSALYPRILLVGLLIIGVFLIFIHKTSAQNVNEIYSDSLSGNWNDWSWGNQVNFSNPSPVESGTKSIWLKLLKWGGFYMHSLTTISLSDYTYFSLSLQLKDEGRSYKLLVYDKDGHISKSLDLGTYGQFTSSKYTSVKIPVADFGINEISGIAIQESGGSDSSELFLDSIKLVKEDPIKTVSANTNYSVFSGTLSASWHDWSWKSINSFTDIISHVPQSGWSGFYLHNDNLLDTGVYKSLNFEIYPTSDSSLYRLVLYDNNNYPIGEFTDINKFTSALKTDEWNTVSIPISKLDPQLVNISGFAVQDASSNIQSEMRLKNIYFSPTIPQTQTTATVPVTAVNSIASVVSDGYTAVSGEIFKDGSKITLNGINWFGFDTTDHVVHGLWVRNFNDYIAQIKELGFNSVRLPLCPDSIKGSAISSVDYSKNPELKGLNSLQSLDKIVNAFNSQNIYILFDFHTINCKDISGLWYDSAFSENEWIDELSAVTKRYQNLDYFLGIDLKNEPHGDATWGSGNLLTDWNLAAERAGSKIHSIDPKILIFVEGIGDSVKCSGGFSHMWGENLEGVNCKPISSDSIPQNKLVYSPHVYGPEVYNQSYFNDPSFPDNMPAIWDTQFGFIKNLNYTLAIGEWGGKYQTTGGSIKEVQFMDAFTRYLSDKHICNNFYWSLNPNSGDTGGILEDDWKTPWPAKTSLINSYRQSCK